jgi:hypothetical protein
VAFVCEEDDEAIETALGEARAVFGGVGALRLVSGGEDSRPRMIFGEGSCAHAALEEGVDPSGSGGRGVV